MKTQTAVVASIMVSALVLGAGCFSRVAAPAGDADRAVSFSGMSPEEATNALTFGAGSTFVIVQEAAVRDGRVFAGGGSESVRTVTVNAFDEPNGIALSWTRTQRLPTQDSLDARAAFEGGEHGENDAPPALTYEDVSDEGLLHVVERSTSHEVALPVRWTEGDMQERSGAVWLSEEAFTELSRTRSTTVYLDAVETANVATLGDAGLQTAVNGLRDHVRDISGRVETDVMKAEGDVVEYTLTVNGAEVRVQAVKVRNWYGEALVLNNAANPLVLKFDFNPAMEGIEAGSEEMNIIKGILSYKITEVTM